MINKFVMSMAMLRMLSGSIEIIAAIVMLRLNQVDKALLVNSGLAVVGPLILISTTTIGLIGMTDKLSLTKLLWVGIGVTCIFIGILKKSSSFRPERSGVEKSPDFRKISLDGAIDEEMSRLRYASLDMTGFLGICMGWCYR